MRATFALVESTGKAVGKLDPSTATAAQVKKAVGDLQKSVKALASAASAAAGQAGSEVKSAVSTFQSQVDAAQGQPASQQLRTLGAAADKLESSLNQTIAQLGCKQ